MGTRLKYLLLLALVVLEVTAFGQFNWNRLRRYKQTSETDKLSAKNAGTKEAYFTQKLTHFDSKITTTWKQRYWQNDAYAQDNGVQFLNIGGEGEEDAYTITNPTSPMVVWARKLNARLWNLEHRYYGRSKPTKDMSVENLKYLDSRQALADLADFIKAKNEELKIKDPKWIVFGGSYPGALVLWFRQKYPDLTIGGIGSSAPIDAVTDFFDYLRVCEDSYRTFHPTCANNIKAGFDALHKLLDTKDGRDQVDTAFGLKPPLSKQKLSYTHLQNFYSTVMGNFMVAVQYSRVNAGIFKTDASIPDVCKIMMEPGVNAISRLVKVNAYIEKSFHQNPLVTYDNYEDQVADLKRTAFETDASDSRAWVWQTCNEFGYFQSTTYDGIFGADVPVEYYYNLCVDVYGKQYNIDYTQAQVKATVAHYGRARDYNGTNVVIPNGSLDPWHALGTYATNNPTAIPFLIEGTAHCADMEPEGKDDVEGLKKVRDLIYSKLQEWTGTRAASSRADRLTKTEPERRVPKADEERVGGKARRTLKSATKICWNCEMPEVKMLNAKSTSEEAVHKRSFVGGRPVGGGMLNHLLHDGLKSLSEDTVKTNHIVQPIDHFNDSDTRTFKQLFFSNDKYYKAGGPVFLFIGGEGPADSRWLSLDIPLQQWAKKYNAMLFEVEHRFYGKTQPFNTMSLNNLKYLTSEQALGDLATFIKQTNKEKGWTNVKWIPYGGSYSGALSAWFRELYPDLAYAAVGSSGPVQAEVDFYGYLQTVQASLRTRSDKCADTLKKAMDKIHDLFQTEEGRNTLSDQLSVRPRFDNNPLDSISSFAFFSEVINPLMGQVQYSDKYNGVNNICDELENPFEDDPIDKLQAARGYEITGRSIVPYINEFKRDGDSRAWIWQTCNEFGYYQSTDIGYNAFGSALPVNFYLRWCSDAFDLSLVRDKLEQNIDFTNQKYGGAQGYKSSRVIQLYGTIDPWHSLGYYPVDGNQGEDVVTILINGTSHCSDMTRSGDKIQIDKALKTLESYLDKWLK